MPEIRRLAVPEGLSGMRADAGLARLLGMSRTSVATMIDSGDVLVDGTAVGRSARLAADSWLEITLPEPEREPHVTPERVEGLTVLYRDADIVVVDKPVGVAAHPSPGWTGPTVLGALAGLGIDVATSGAAERQGIVHRLDVGTTGVMVVALSEHAYRVLKDAFRERTVRQGLPRARAGPSGSERGHDRRADRPASRRRTGSSRSSPAAGTPSRTTRRSRRSPPPACSRCSWKPDARTRSGCTSRPCGTRAWAT